MNRSFRSFSIYHKHRLKYNPTSNISVQAEEPDKPENKHEYMRKSQSPVNLNQKLSQTPTLPEKQTPLDKILDSWLVDN